MCYDKSYLYIFDLKKKYKTKTYYNKFKTVLKIFQWKVTTVYRVFLVDFDLSVHLKSTNTCNFSSENFWHLLIWKAPPD